MPVRDKNSTPADHIVVHVSELHTQHLQKRVNLYVVPTVW